MRDLYERIDEALNILAEDCEGSEPLFAMHSALRAAVERHKPEFFGGVWACLGCSPGMPPPILINGPCEELRDIAKNLGIEEEERRAPVD
jgi:hypothetical protein